MNFHDKIVLVTGGTGGLAAEVHHGVSRSGGDDGGYLSGGGRICPLSCPPHKIGAAPPTGVSVDVTDAQAVEKFVAATVAKHGRLSISL